MPEDIVAFINLDIGLTSMAADKLIDGIARGNGVTCCPRRVFPGNYLGPKPGRIFRSVTNLRTDGGFDLFAMTPQWWKVNRAKMPDMLIGREAWDTVFRNIAEEWATRRGSIPELLYAVDGDWSRNPAYTDDVIWHKEHLSHWQKERTTSPGQIHNRNLGRAFFAARGNHSIVQQLSR